MLMLKLLASLAKHDILFACTSCVWNIMVLKYSSNQSLNVDFFRNKLDDIFAAQIFVISLMNYQSPITWKLMHSCSI